MGTRGQSAVSNTDITQFLWRALAGPFLLLSAPGCVGGDIDDNLVYLLLRGSFLRCAAHNIRELDEQCDPQLQLFTAMPCGPRDTDSMGKYTVSPDGHTHWWYERPGDVTAKECDFDLAEQRN